MAKASIEDLSRLESVNFSSLSAVEFLTLQLESQISVSAFLLAFFSMPLDCSAKLSSLLSVFKIGVRLSAAG